MLRLKSRSFSFAMKKIFHVRMPHMRIVLRFLTGLAGDCHTELLKSALGRRRRTLFLSTVRLNHIPVLLSPWKLHELWDGTYTLDDLLDITELILVRRENEIRAAEARKVM